MIRSRNDSTLWTSCFPMTGPFPRMSPCSVAFANRIRIRPFAPFSWSHRQVSSSTFPSFTPGRTTVAAYTSTAPQSFSRIASEASGVGSCMYFFRSSGSVAKTVKEISGEPVLDEEIGDRRIVPALPARVPDVERGFRAPEQFDEILELRVTARVARRR